MKNPSANQAGREGGNWRCPASKIVLIYLLVGGMWILFSDMLLRWITSDADLTEKIGIYKGLFFVAATGGMLFFLIRKWFSRLGQSGAELQASEERYRSLFVNMTEGFAYCRMLFENGRPVDFVYLEVNDAFTRQTGLKNVVGRKASEVIPGIREADPGLLERYGRVALTGQPEQFENFVTALQMWFNISVYSPAKEHFVAVFDVITERKATEKALRASETRFRQIVASIEDVLYGVDSESLEFNYMSPVFERMLGYTLDDVTRLGGREKFLTAVIQGGEFEKQRALFRKLQAAPTNTAPRWQAWWRCKDGSLKFIEDFSLPVYFEGDLQSTFGVLRDITERKLAEQRILHLNDVLQAIRAIGHLIHTEKDPQSLLQKACEVLMQTRNYVTVWIGRPEPGSKLVTSIAHAGGPSNFSTHAPITWDDTSTGRGPTGTAIRERRAVVVEDVAADPNFAPWRTDVAAAGAASLASVPLLHGDRLFGSLTVKADRVRFFTEDEVRLLSSLASDLAFALQSFEEEQLRRQMEQTLRESEFFFKESQRVAGIGSYKCDFISNAWVSSEVLNQILGIDKHHSRNVEGWLAIVHPDDRAMMERYFTEEVIGKRRRFDKEYRIVRPADGETRWMHGIGELGCDPDGKVVSMTGTILDITERKKSEQALHLLNRLYSLLSRVNELIIHSHSDHELFQGVCDAAIHQGGFKLAWIGLVKEETKRVLPVALTGEAADYVKGLEIFTDERPGGRGPTGICIRTGQAYICNDYLIDPCTAPWHEWARPHHLLASASIPFQRNGKVAGALMIYNDEVNCFEAPDVALLEEIARDISFALDNLATQAKARQLSRAVEQSPVSIVITNTQGNIEYVNPKFTQVTGYSPAEALGKNPRILKSGELSLNQAAFYKELWDTLTAGRDWHGEFHNRKKNGEYYWEAAAISPIFDPAGNITHFVAVKEDITTRKHLEDELRQVQKMQAIGQLAAGVAHDFNNILTVIMGNVSLLKMGTLPAGKQAEVLAQISKSAERAASLARQLLLFSRRQSLLLQDLDLNETIANFSRMLHSLIGENIALVTRYTSGSTLVHADPGTLEQVLMNLIVNARDALPPTGGQITIQTENVRLDESSVHNRLKARPGDFIRLNVSDNGCGISPENLQHIFEPFFTTKQVGKGTGLGLAMVFGIIEQHKGWVEVESRVGAGTTFHIYLPRVVTKTNSPAIPPQHAPEPGGTETILVAEDDPAASTTIRNILELHGYRVLAAESGEAAINVWTENQASIRLLITDMVMPGDLNGQQLARHLKAQKPDLKVIYVSGYNSENLTDGQSLRQDPNFIAKPYSIETILRKVRARLDGRD